MIKIPALRLATTVTRLCIALAVSLWATTALAQQPQISDEDLLKAKCTLCHSGHRIYQLTAEQIRPVVERMQKMNPDWISQIESEHIADVITKVLDDPTAVVMREAWIQSVARGEQIFSNPALGTNGKTCSSCHAKDSLKNIEDAYPKFDPVRKRFVDISEAINYMIQERMKGTPLPANDQRYFDLLAYIKSL